MKRLERFTPVWVIKIGGSPSFGDYLDMFLGENLTEQELRAMWNKQTERQIPDKFIVKRIYENDEALEVGVSFDVQKYDYFHDGLKLGAEYIVFFHKNAKGYHYDSCDAIPVKLLEQSGVMPGGVSWSKLVSIAIENKLFPCMWNK